MSGKTHYTVVMVRKGGAEPRLKTAHTYEEAAKIAHRYFLSFDFRFEDGKMLDYGMDPPGDETFSEVKMFKGMVAEFTHRDGEGPTCHIEKT